MLDERSERVNTTGRKYRDARHVVTTNGAERLDRDLVAHTLHEDNGRRMLDAGNRPAGRRPSELARRAAKDGLQMPLVTCHCGDCTLGGQDGGSPFPGAGAVASEVAETHCNLICKPAGPAAQLPLIASRA